MTASRYLLDSSAWLSYVFTGGEHIKEIIDGENILYTSVLSLFEIKRRLLKEDTPNDMIEKFMHLITVKSLIIKLDEETCRQAAEISWKEGLAAIDALICAVSLSQNTILVTGDNDFRGKKDVLMIG